MAKRISFSVGDFKNLQLHIYTIGYPQEGETIITIIYDKAKRAVLFTSLTDCYKDKALNYNHIQSVLKEYGNPSINVFIWTHPDEDHSLGIPEILNCYDSKHEAVIYIPASLDRQDAFPICKESMKAFTFLMKNYDCNQKYLVKQVTLTDQESRSLYVIELIEERTRRTIHCSFNFLAPFGSLLLRRSAGDKPFVMNDLSIVYAMKINGYNFLYCGDLANQSVQFLNEDFFQNVSFVKIPHHGSDEPKGFMRKLLRNGVKGVVATTTIYGGGKLPVEGVINGYKGISREIYGTGSGKEKFGCVGNFFNISDFICYTELSGNALCYYEQS